MTVRDLVNYLEALPVSDVELEQMDVHIRVPSSSGSYNHVTTPLKCSIEKLPHKEKDVIIITTGGIYDID